MELLEGAGIEVLKFVSDGLVEVGEAEEGVVAQGGQDPAFGNEDGAFDFGFIFWLCHPGGDDHGSIVFGKILIGRVDIGFVAAGMRDAGG